MEFNNNVPIYLQVIEDIKKRIVLNELALGSQLPSVRDLAVEYKINPNTASRIYKEMELQGLCFTKRGLGTFIIDDQKIQDSLRKEMAASYNERYCHDMTDLGFSRTEIIEQIDHYLGVVSNKL